VQHGLAQCIVVSAGLWGHAKTVCTYTCNTAAGLLLAHVGHHCYGVQPAVLDGAHTPSPVSEGFVGDPWLSVVLTLGHILHYVSHWLAFVYFIFNPSKVASAANSVKQTAILCRMIRFSRAMLAASCLVAGCLGCAPCHACKCVSN
jgi:hypothetical protein